MEKLIKAERVDELAELRRHEQRLKQTVHVTSGALVAKTDVALKSFW